MSTKKCLHLLEKNPIIAAIRDPKDIYDAVASPCQIVFLLTGNIYNLKTMIDYINVAGKYAFVHLDLLKGYGQDHYFVKYLKEELHPTGIISTRNSLITIAKRENLMTIQRLFLLDSSAMDVTINAARKIKPGAVEVLPGLVSKVIRKGDDMFHHDHIAVAYRITADKASVYLDLGERYILDHAHG